MREALFDHVNIPKAENIHIPDGTIPLKDVDAYCEAYERAIEKAGGIDLQILGIGRTGHIGFNEPGSPRDSRTRMVTLDPVTRQDAASDFFGDENVPLQALTMGVGTILEARKIVIIALGEHKAKIVRRAVEEPISEEVTASFLQAHRNVTFALDLAAASDLTAIQTPWLVGPVRWTPALEKRAVIWLSQTVKKPLLKLEARDFVEHRLHELLRECGPTEAIRQRVFNDLLGGHSCTRPGGKERQKVIVFSPHPDDDVISMGGTLWTLYDQGHDVNIAYMTSGNIAVFDHDALRHINYVSEFHKIFALNTEPAEALCEKLHRAITTKQSGDFDTEEVLNVKSLIRKTGSRRRRRRRNSRREGRQTAFPRTPLLPHGKGLQTAARRRGRGDHRQAIAGRKTGPDLRGRRPVRSARHAPCLCPGDPQGPRSGESPRREYVPGKSGLTAGVAGIRAALRLNGLCR